MPEPPLSGKRTGSTLIQSRLIIWFQARKPELIETFGKIIKSMDLIYNESPNREEQKFIDDKLIEYNQVQISGYGYEYFTYKIVDGSKRIVAGINCEVGGGWLYIIGLWVDENLRGNGLGEKLLIAAEEKAKRKGCHGAYLYSYSFQAPKFYKKKGYTIFGELENFCPNHSKIFLKKRFQ